MVGRFLLLNEKKTGGGEKAIIVNIDNIGRVYSENGGTTIEMNYLQRDGVTQVIHVVEGFEWLKTALEAHR